MANTLPTGFITRRPITNAQLVVVGYALYGAPVHLNGQEWPLGEWDVFVKCRTQDLMHNPADAAQPHKVVRLFAHLPDPVAPDSASLIEHLAQLQKGGARFAFEHTVLHPQYAAFWPLAHAIAVDLGQLSPDQALLLATSARQHTSAKVLAMGVDTAEQFHHMVGGGATLLQGGWVARPTVIKNRAASPSQVRVLQFINLVRSKASVDAMEEVLKGDAMLGFKLMRLINSSGFGRTHEVASFRHAVMLLGLDRLFRWAALLLTAASANGAPAVVGTTAVVRARMMELLAKTTFNVNGGTESDTDEGENAFTVGLFSLLDDMLGMPLEQALALLPLPPTIKEALRYGSGTYGPLLALAKACEAGDDRAMRVAAAKLSLTHTAVNQAHLDALAWAANLAL